MTSIEPKPGSRPETPRLERSADDRLLGGVCAGIASHLGIDPLLVRIAAVAVALVSAGWGGAAYLVAWILIPPARGRSRRRRLVAPSGDSGVGVRDAWMLTGAQLRSLAAGLRSAGPADEIGGPPLERSPIAVVDQAMTAVGERVRDEQVKASARSAASSLSAAVGASVGGFAHRRSAATSNPDGGSPS